MFAQAGVAAGLVLLLLYGCAPTDSVPVTENTAPSVTPPPIARPAQCVDVAPGAALQPLLDSAAEDDAYCLTAGDYAAPVRIGKRVTVWGPREASINSSGDGTTVELSGGATLLGITVDGSGGRFDTLDAAVHVTGDDARVEGVLVQNATFGLLVEKSTLR